LTNASIAKQRLVRLLQMAHAAELAAYIAYHGHERSVRDPVEKAEIRRIAREELRHRRMVREILHSLGAAPAPVREATMPWVGRGIWLICFLSGWFVPMYGAARLERNNVGEYVTAARLAIAAGCPEHVAACVEMAEVEWDHEAYFHRKARTHRLMRLFPDWPDPAPRAAIRAEFAGVVGATSGSARTAETTRDGPRADVRRGEQAVIA
jgi:hypothetical protein